MKDDVYATLARPKRHRFVTLRELVRQALEASRNPVAIRDIYERVEGHPRLEDVRAWKSRVRQTLHRHGEFHCMGDGLWRLRSEDELRCMNEVRPR